MLAALLIPLTLIASVLAAPSRTSLCDIFSVTVDIVAGGSLPEPTHKVSFVGLGMGTQNYTCSSAGNYTSAGALAELYDISCYNNLSAGALSDISSQAFMIWKNSPSFLTEDTIIEALHTSPARSSLPVLGEHYFVQNGSSVVPKWDFTSHAFAGNENAFVLAAKKAGMTAPTGSQDVDWLYLTNAAGELATEVYRTDTRGGQPPSSCTPGSDPIFIKYISIYWFTGTSEVVN